jgi:nicotinate-nucleotide--dimethylbenzimidazole phosphoribosyltransferase
MTMEEKIQFVIDRKTKPPKSFGKLEELALHIGKLQGTVHQKLVQPHILVFAADHGIAEEGISAYHREVTRQMVLNFLHNGAAINVFARQHGIKLKIIDAGVKGSLPHHPGLSDAKVREGTRNFLHEPAVTYNRLQECINHGEIQVKHLQKSGCNVIGFGEMGISNTASASMIMHLPGNITLEQ